MVSMRNLAFVASSILSFVSAAPTLEKRQDTWVPGTLNNTQEFYLHMAVTDGDYTHQEWVCKSPISILLGSQSSPNFHTYKTKHHGGRNVN
jgi:hypothetical protein